MTGFTLKAKADPKIAESLFYSLSRLAYGQSCHVKSETFARNKSEKELTIHVHGPSSAVQAALQETRAYIGGASDVLSSTSSSKQGCALEIELTLV